MKKNNDGQDFVDDWIDKHNVIERLEGLNVRVKSRGYNLSSKILTGDLILEVEGEPTFWGKWKKQIVLNAFLLSCGAFFAWRGWEALLNLAGLIWFVNAAGLVYRVGGLLWNKRKLKKERS